MPAPATPRSSVDVRRRHRRPVTAALRTRLAPRPSPGRAAWRPPRGRAAGTLLSGVLAASLALTACAADPEAAAQDAQGADGGAAPQDAVTTIFDPADFDDPATGRNPYLPLTPGRQSVRDGSTLIGGRRVPHQVTTTITDVYREIAGVRTVALLDHEIDAGQVTQISVDYMAEDKAGNVWLVGGYTEQYEGGQFVAAADAWMHGVNGAEAGILVHADPKVGSPLYSVAKLDEEEDDVAQVEQVGVRHCVPFDCFDDVLVIREGKANAPDNEFKYYARDVGQIDNVPREDSRHKDVEQLINLTMLSSAALAESSQEALRLDHNAAEQAPAIFADGPAGARVTG